MATQQASASAIVRRGWRAGRGVILAAALVIVAGCGARGLARADTPLVCPKTDGLAERAVAEAVAAFPGPLDPVTLEKRRTYINLNLARLFDPKGTGYLDLQRYDDWSWAGTMASDTSIQCAMNMEQYRHYLYGTDQNIRQIDKFRPYTAQVDAITFAQLSSDGKYITRQDLMRQWSRLSFRNFDTNGDGRAWLNGQLAALFGKQRK